MRTVLNRISGSQRPTATEQRKSDTKTKRFLNEQYELMEMENLKRKHDAKARENFWINTVETKENSFYWSAQEKFLNEIYDNLTRHSLDTEMNTKFKSTAHVEKANQDVFRAFPCLFSMSVRG